MGAQAEPDAPAHAAEQAERSPTERIFAHWVFMLGKRRAALGPGRRKAIERMLALYDEETLQLAIEGCAASAWHAGQNDRGRAFDDLELILRDEAHVERFAADGEALRERAEREVARQAQASREAERAVLVEIDPAACSAARARMQQVRFDIAKRLRGRV
jgi:hypothetical protein